MINATSHKTKSQIKCKDAISRKTVTAKMSHQIPGVCPGVSAALLTLRDFKIWYLNKGVTHTAHLQAKPN